MRRLLLVLALVLAPSAGAANVATPKMEAVASWAAGKPISVHCESDEQEWARMTASVGHVSDQAGYAPLSGSTVYIGPTACAWLGRDDAGRGYGLNILLHEATHARGWADEALTECAARVLVYSALNRFYGVPWFSARMRTTTDLALNYSRSKSVEYQGGCDRL